MQFKPASFIPPDLGISNILLIPAIAAKLSLIRIPG